MSALATAPVFPLVGAGHPLERDLEAFRAAMADDPRLAGPCGEREVKARRLPGGEWVVERLYCFVPARDQGAFGGALLHARGGDPEVYEFPHDPRLPALAAVGSPLLADTRAEVLRYVPLRRPTFRAAGPDGRARVGKFKRPSTLEGAYRRLVSVSRAARAADAGFAVPRPAGLDVKRSVFWQERATGTDAATLVDAATLEGVMATVGRVHRAVHALEVADAASGADFAAFVRALDRDLEWIAFMAGPAAIPRLGRVAARLAARVPAPAGAEQAFCHGDYVTSQLLIDGERVTVLDFDLAAAGDPYRDVAMLMASLPFDVPYLGAAGDAQVERARAAYLAAYEERAGTALDGRRLAWHRVCAAIYQVAMRMRKGRADHVEVERSLDGLVALAEALR
jgi:aminoglycoside phosphotransferase (APT) family kinase protein